MKRTHSLLNMYFTAAVSVFLVLLLIGTEAILALSTTSAVKKLRENVTMSVVMADDADSLAVAQLDSIFTQASYCHAHVFISKEQALEEHIAQMGEDPSEFLGFNPLSDSYDIHPTDIYSNPDSMALIDSCISSLPYVEQVIYQPDLLSMIDSNVNRASVVLGVLGLTLLLIAMVLIINTIRLQIYSKRFIINTMTLVGATSWNIRAPFLWKNVLMGFITSVCACVVLLLIVHYFGAQIGITLFEANWINYLCVFGVITTAGILITLVASLIATGRYIRMRLDKMYEI